MSGLTAEARLRGTDVMLAAAARSLGATTAITYELRVGTSIWDNALRARRSAIAKPSDGANGIRISRTLDGKCVKTMVLTRPNRSAMRVATKYESAEKTPVQKKIVPATAIDN